MRQDANWQVGYFDCPAPGPGSPGRRSLPLDGSVGPPPTGVV